jgi:5'-phosphate synthase pdxT subunit
VCQQRILEEIEERMKIGVLALQGAFREHQEVLERLGTRVVEVRQPEDLRECEGLVLPGGETTTQRKLAQTYGLWDPIARLGSQGLPILATCAGLILLAKQIDGEPESSLDILDVDVRRNAYGRQVFSFETLLDVPSLSTPGAPSDPFRAIFIRAPRIVRIGQGVSVLASHDGEPVAVKQGSILGLSFHPELTRDDRFHTYFLQTVQRQKALQAGQMSGTAMQAAVGDRS